MSSVRTTGALSSFLGGHLADTIGRPQSMAASAVIFGVGAAREANSGHLAMLFVELSTTVVYICEAVSVKGRGVVASAPRFFATVALGVGLLFCYGTVNMKSSLAWRIQLAFQSPVFTALRGHSPSAFVLAGFSQ